MYVTQPPPTCDTSVMTSWVMRPYLYLIIQICLAMSLKNELSELSCLIRNETSPRLIEVLDRFTDALREQNVRGRCLKVGDVVENATLNMPKRGRVELHTLLGKGPVVLNFYRGGWCPYCSLELKALHHAWPAIERQGAQLIAISPERPESIARTVRKNELDYPVVHDANSEVAQQFGLAVSLSEPLKALYRSLGLNLAARHADVMVRLPMPATFMIGVDHTVQYAFVDEDYTQRAEPVERVSGAAECYVRTGALVRINR